LIEFIDFGMVACFNILNEKSVGRRRPAPATGENWASPISYFYAFGIDLHFFFTDDFGKF